MRFSRTIIISMCLMPLGILVLMEACAPMKSGLVTTGSLSSPSSSASSVCSADFAPASSTVLHSKALLSENNSETVAPFEEQKVQLTGTFSSKAVSTLKNQTVVVVLDMNCKVNDNSSLSAKVLAQHSGLKTELSRKALEYSITEDISPDAFTSLAEQDPCVVGVVPQATVKLASLALPPVNDTELQKQSYLISTNYSHAYQHLVAKQKTNIKVNVGLVDTGISCSHPDLVSNIASNCGYNVTDIASSPEDNDGHGSLVAGLIGAVSGNATGVIGVSGNGLSITAIKVIDVQSSPVSIVTDGIQYAIDNHMDVINISLESPSKVTSIENAVVKAVQAGIVVVMAAGNGSLNLMSNSSSQVSPAGLGKSLAGAITVGSVDSATNQLSYFSNFGSYVELAAPGAVDSSLGGSAGGLYSTYKNGTYYRLMGTSQAAPLVTGAVTLLIHFFKANNVAYTPANIETIIVNSTDTPAALNVNQHRLLNYSKLVRNAYAFANLPLCK